MSDLVSIVTPTYNSQKFISQTIKSVQSQSVQDWELIIVDDASTDRTCDIVIEEKENDSRICLIRLSENKKAAYARNKAIESANGRYIAFIDSDDLWQEDKLEKQLHFMKTHKYPFSYTAYKKIDENGKIISDLINVPASVDYNQLLYSNVIGCLTAIYDTAITGKVYGPLINMRNDLALWLNILKKGYRAYGLNECLAFYRIKGNSLSHNKIKAAYYQWLIYRNYEHLSLSKSIRCFLNYSVFGYRKFKA